MPTPVTNPKVRYMGLEIYQEAGASVREEAAALVNNVSAKDIENYVKVAREKAQDGGCFHLLPDCGIDFDDDMPGMSGGLTDKCFPLRIPEGDSTWGSIRERLFGPNYDDLARKVGKAAEQEAVSKLSPEERRKYEEEKAAMEAYYERQFTRMSLLDHNELPPHTPTLDKVSKDAAQIENAARERVIDNLTPDERARYEEERRRYDEASNSRWDGDDLMMCIYRPMPQAGPMMREVERRTAGVIRSHSYGNYRNPTVCKELT